MRTFHDHKNWLPVVAALVLCCGACSSAPQPAEIVNDIIGDLKKGPGNEVPSFIGAGENHIYYRLNVAESDDLASLSGFQSNLYSIDYRDKSVSTVLTFIPSDASQLQASNTNVAWVSRNSGSPIVEVVNLETLDRRTLYEFASESSNSGFVGIRMTTVGIVIKDNDELIIFDDLANDQEPRTLVFEGLVDFDVFGDHVVVSTFDAEQFDQDSDPRALTVTLLHEPSDELITLAHDVWIYDGPFIQGNYVVWAQYPDSPDAYLDDAIQVLAYNVVTGETRFVIRLGEGVLGELDLLLAGKSIESDALRGTSQDFVLVTTSRPTADRIRDKVHLISLVNGDERTIGDFLSIEENFFGPEIENTVEIFGRFAVWYNGVSNEIVMYDLESFNKKKKTVKP